MLSPNLEVYTSTKPGAVNVGTIAMCVRDHLNAATFISLLSMDYTFLHPGEAVKRTVVQGSMLVLQRNECLRQMEGDWVLFIDDDMVFEPDAVSNLVSAWRETQARTQSPVIMGGLCFRRGFPFEPTMYMRERRDGGKYRFLEKWIPEERVEVDATGMAFALIPTTVLAAIMRLEWPSFEDRQANMPPPFFEWQGGTGEDIRFCQMAVEAGCRIFVDTSIQIGHVAEVTIGTREYLRSIADRPADDEERVRAANDAMGLPTLSAQEARELLA